MIGRVHPVLASLVVETRSRRRSHPARGGRLHRHRHTGGLRSDAGARALKVVATTTVLADMVRQVGGTNVDVTSIVPKGGVVETFDPSPRDIAAVSAADLVVMNGLGLDDWLERVINAANPDVPVVRLAEDLPGVDYVTGEAGEAENPHLWLDVSNGARYAGRIADALATADPARTAAFRAGDDAYAARLDALDATFASRSGRSRQGTGSS